jgi:hypothetical protein
MYLRLSHLILHSCHVLVETGPCPAVRDALMAKSYTDKTHRTSCAGIDFNPNVFQLLVTGLAPIAVGNRSSVNTVLLQKSSTELRRRLLDNAGSKSGSSSGAGKSETNIYSASPFLTNSGSIVTAYTSSLNIPIPRSPDRPPQQNCGMAPQRSKDRSRHSTFLLVVSRSPN